MNITETGTINVVYGANDLDLYLGGFSVEEIQFSLQNVFNVDMTALAFIDGVQVSSDFLLPPSVRLEFMQTWGHKGTNPAYLDRLICGDASDVMRRYGIRANLIVTSPQYADARRSTYGGVHPDDYVDWFMPYADQFYESLASDGTLILNIKEKVVHGERHSYVHDLIREMRRRGWLWTEDWCWHKTNCTPGKWPNRFRDAWEHILQFNKSRQFAMFQDAVMVPAAESTKKRVTNLSEKDMQRQPSRVGSGFGKRIANWIGRDFVYPSNVLYGPTECGNTGHPAAFPEWLPEFFIKLFTVSGDVVCDPFVGSGTSAVAAKRNGRHYIGIDDNREYIEIARKRLGRGLQNNH